MKYYLDIYTKSFIPDGDFFQLSFEPRACDEEDAWKVAEKLLSYFPEGSYCDLYQDGEMVWHGRVVFKDADRFLIGGNFGCRVEFPEEQAYLEN